MYGQTRTDLARKEIVMVMYGKEAFTFVSPNEVGLWAQGEGGGNGTQGKDFSGKFQIV